MKTIKLRIASWLRGMADRLDPPKVQTADGGPGNPTKPT
jgi:hypothetical protein